MKSLLNDKIKKALVDLVYTELRAAKIYRAFASWCDAKGYFGAQSWYLKQSDEETEHAQKVIDYINDRGCDVGMPAIAGIDVKATTLIDVLNTTLTEEMNVETAWTTFASLCMKENDLSSFSKAMWFVEEQIHEIDKVANLITEIETMVAGGTAIGLACYHINKAMGC